MARSNNRGIPLVFPAGGLDKSMAFQSQPPYTTPDCLNVRPFDPILERLRGGSRPGLARAYQQQLGSGSPVNMLVDLDLFDDSKFRNWTDIFEGEELGEVWTQASWIANEPLKMPDSGIITTFNDPGGVVRDALPNLDTSSEYTIEIYISPYESAFGGKYQIFARMNNATPVATTEGIIAELIMDGTDGVYSGTLKEYNSGTPTSYNFTGGTLDSVQSGYFSVKIDGNDITCKWNGNTLLNAQTVTAHTGSRIGFGMDADDEGDVCLIELFRARYFITENDLQKRVYLLAASGGKLYRENNDGEMAQIFSTPPLASAYPIYAVQRGQNVYIADWEPWKRKDDDNNGTVATDGVTFDDSAVADWTTLGINTDGDVLILETPTGNITAGTYRISAVVAGNITLATDARTDTGSATGGTVSYKIGKAPKVYDPIANTLSIWTASSGNGVVPTGCPLIFLYRDRVGLAGDIEDPQNWYMPRSGDPLDWDYSPLNTDAQRAVAGNNSNAGKFGKPIIAVMPSGDDYMAFGGHKSLWQMIGDPADGGIIVNIDNEIGVVDAGAWTENNYKETIFLSTFGLYKFRQGERAVPQPITDKELPAEFLNLNPGQQHIILQWNQRFNGIHIFTTRVGKEHTLHYWYDQRTDSIWVDTFLDDYEPYSAIQHSSPYSVDRKMIVGCFDGRIRYFDNTREDDDGTVFTNYVTYGPFMLGSNQGTEDGEINELLAVLGNQSGNVTWEVLVSDSVQNLKNITPVNTGTWVAGENYANRPQERGRAMLLKVKGLNGKRWAMESITVWRERLGKYAKR